MNCIETNTAMVDGSTTESDETEMLGITIEYELKYEERQLSMQKNLVKTFVHMPALYLLKMLISREVPWKPSFNPSWDSAL